MAAGGIHDQLGGGFHRYATDASWLVPHFEQMLYDNAQLARVYVHAWALTGDRRYRRHGDRRPRLPPPRAADGRRRVRRQPGRRHRGRGGRRRSSGPRRGPRAPRRGRPDAALFAAAYGVTDAGNWEGRTILSRVRATPSSAERFGHRGRGRRRAARDAARGRCSRDARGRPQPARDDKVLAAWNGLAIAALADAARALGRDRRRRRTRRRRTATRRPRRGRAGAVLAGLRTPDGRLRRSWKDGRATADGVLEDYANLADGLLALYEATFDERWFRGRVRSLDVVLEHFADPAGGFFDTADDGERARRPAEGRPGQRDAVGRRDGDDRAPPARGADRRGPLPRRRPSGRSRRSGRYLARYPTAFAQWLCALELAHAGIDGGRDRRRARTIRATARLLDVVDRGYHAVPGPRRRPATRTLGGAAARDRFALDGRPTAFVCRGLRVPPAGHTSPRRSRRSLLGG